MSRVLPMPFIPEMVRAILDERKTVTRRRIKPKQLIDARIISVPWAIGTAKNMPQEYIEVKKRLLKPYCDMPDYWLISAIYKPPCEQGDILYVQEAWTYDDFQLRYMADEYKNHKDEWNRQFIDENKWNPAGSMKKGLARIWLKVIDVRVERLQDMWASDVPKEGLLFTRPHTAEEMLQEFEGLWNSTIKKSDLDLYGWDANPWVWVIEFERCEKPEESKG